MSWLLSVYSAVLSVSSTLSKAYSINLIEISMGLRYSVEDICSVYWDLRCKQGWRLTKWQRVKILNGKNRGVTII